MKKEKHSDDKISEQSLHEILLDIKYRLNHIEDISADNRAIIVKLVKQSNQIVEFLKQVQIEDVTDDFSMDTPLLQEEEERITRMEKVQELLEEFSSKSKELKEFEEELRKNKDKLTPGQIGES
tara:strand:- start:237 stop:608 length:372 start_codon:yes stop_codon:yes gene_type:complete